MLAEAGGEAGGEAEGDAAGGEAGGEGGGEAGGERGEVGGERGEVGERGESGVCDGLRLLNTRVSSRTGLTCSRRWRTF